VIPVGLHRALCRLLMDTETAGRDGPASEAGLAGPTLLHFIVTVKGLRLAVLFHILAVIH
jgi:hypothetical protein